MRYFIATFSKQYSLGDVPNYDTKAVSMDELFKELNGHIGWGGKPSCLINQIEIDEGQYTTLKEQYNKAYEESYARRMEEREKKKAEKAEDKPKKRGFFS